MCQDKIFSIFRMFLNLQKLKAMWGQYCIFIFCISCLLQARNVELKCVKVEGLEGRIFHEYKGPADSEYIRCWDILNPEKLLLRININHTDFKGQGCNNIYLQIKTSDRETKFCQDERIDQPFSTYSDVQINFRAAGYYIFSHYSVPPTFSLFYEFDRDITKLQGIEQARVKAILWLKSRLSSSWAWIENVPKAITGLFLAGGATFNGTSIKEQLMVEQRNLRTSVELLRGTASIEQLSVFINSLLVNCHNPRQFYGRNLINQLKELLEISDNYTHPTAYLALCNANESWPTRAEEDLSYIFSMDSRDPIVRDVQALGVMAFSCKINWTKLENRVNHVFEAYRNESLMFLYKQTIRRLKQKQLPNGSFGNPHSTALITQALVSSGCYYDEDWKSKAVMKFLMKEMNSSDTNFLTTYLTLPLLNGKTLADIARINCSGKSNDLISDIHDYLGKKMMIQYSLLLGDNKEVIHTMSLKVPQNFTAYDVMRYAEAQEEKYKFLWERVDGKMHVYNIASIPNDPEERKFWLLYVSSTNSTRLFSNPELLGLKNGDHLIMWYKTADF